LLLSKENCPADSTLANSAVPAEHTVEQLVFQGETMLQHETPASALLGRKSLKSGQGGVKWRLARRLHLALPIPPIESNERTAT
jgi:hypothetical protein